MALTLNNQYFCATLRLMIMHQHTKFGLKRLSGSGDVPWFKTVQEIFPDKIWTHGVTDTATLSPPHFRYEVGGGVKGGGRVWKVGVGCGVNETSIRTAVVEWLRHWTRELIIPTGGTMCRNLSERTTRRLCSFVPGILQSSQW